MFMTLIAVVVVLVIIVGYMSQSTTGTSSDKAAYYTEAQKVKSLISTMKGEALFYYQGNNESYKGISPKYFKDVGFSSYLFKDTAGVPMLGSEWMGIASDDSYEGIYMTVGGPIGDNMRIIIEPTNKDTADEGAGYILKIVGLDKDGDNKVDVDDPDNTYPAVLEAVMSSDTSFLGG
jgi:hypothetical protein